MRNGRNAKSPAFQFYPGDYLSDPKVAAMTTEAEGVYLRLLCFAWLDGSIPDAPELLAPMCKLSLESFTRCWSTVQRCWVQSFPGQLVNPRMERERNFQHDSRERRLAASRAAVVARERMAHESSTNRATDDPLTRDPIPDTRVEEHPPTPRRGKRAPRAVALELVLPETLEPARAAVQAWLAYKAEIRKPYRQEGLSALLKRLARWGPQKAEQAIEQSMASGWAGLFEPMPPRLSLTTAAPTGKLPEYKPLLSAEEHKRRDLEARERFERLRDAGKNGHAPH